MSGDDLAGLVLFVLLVIFTAALFLSLWWAEKRAERHNRRVTADRQALQGAVDALTREDREWLTEVGYRPPAGIFWRLP